MTSHLPRRAAYKLVYDFRESKYKVVSLFVQEGYSFPDLNSDRRTEGVFVTKRF